MNEDRINRIAAGIVKKFDKSKLPQTDKAKTDPKTNPALHTSQAAAPQGPIPSKNQQATKPSQANTIHPWTNALTTLSKNIAAHATKLEQDGFKDTDHLNRLKKLMGELHGEITSYGKNQVGQVQKNPVQPKQKNTPNFGK